MKRIRWYLAALFLLVVLAPLLAQVLFAAPPDKEWDTKIVTNSIGMKLALIPAGKFVMGSPKDERDRCDDEEQHEVEITKPYYLGVYHVTQLEYEKIMGKNPSDFSATGSNKDEVKGMDTSRFPVENVSWDDTVEFCKKLSELSDEKKAGRTYRLPTEAEWEYACRAGTTTAFHSENSLSSEQANFDGNHPHGEAAKGKWLERPTTVGSYQPNAFGLYDMHGNAEQWCQDWYDDGYYKNSPKQDPAGPENGSDRVVRGGSWCDFDWFCRSAVRLTGKPGNRNDARGFRVAAVQSGR